ncbi:hypothetical protein Pmani_033112 [Petrolisthes manimaculis]|uniref:Uncharacterized protein n=1 Tax=Petrolisthes manimaculis TaxID=1843537 RepID=A0AAE1TQS8_9EUCA|nr:hypothetical protein Pmani_033112 [Petrolisthes manimaculis]
MSLEIKKRKAVRAEPRIRWWKLNEDEYSRKFREEVSQVLGDKIEEDRWETISEVVRQKAKKVLGVTSGRRKEDKETWWWNEEVQESISKKKRAKMKWDRQMDEESKQEYKEMQSTAKEVAKAKDRAYEKLYEKLDSREGEKDLYRLARQRDRAGRDVQHVKMIKDVDGNILTSEESVLRRWKEYFEQLMNIENVRERRLEEWNEEVQEISRDEVRKAMKKAGTSEMSNCSSLLGHDRTPLSIDTRASSTAWYRDEFKSTSR